MKKLFLLLAAVGMIFTACENFGIDDPQLPQIEVAGGEESLSLNFPSEVALAKTVTFSSNYDWSVTTSDAWIKVSPESGKASEECQITVSLDRNETYDVREGKITIGVQELSVDIPVSQQPQNGLMLSNPKVSLPQSGGAFDVAILSNVDFEYEIKSEWIKAVESRALAESTVRFEAEANPTTDLRTGEILFKGEGLTATLTVTQSQTNVITLSTSTVEIDGKGGIFSIDVLANVEYEVAIEEGCDWISRADSRAMTESILNFTVSENKTDAARSATISISGEGVEEKITVKQECVASIPKNTIYYTSTDGAIVTPYATDVFGANIVSNTYADGKGVITFDGDVTQIGERAFQNRRSLETITIPNSVTEIGNGAFVYCTSLIDIAIGNSVTTIGADAFVDCTSLTSVTIPDSVTSIGDTPFAGCISLSAFYGKYASMDNRCLIVDKVLIAFASSGLTEYTIPDGITSIGNSALAYSTSLTSITIPDGVVSIGEYALRACKLTSITIPDSVIEVGGAAFCNCPSLTAFYGKFASADNRCLIVDGVLNSFAPAGLTEYTIPDSIISIGNSAFSYCAKLTSVTIPDSVTEIGSFTFSYCTSLASVTIDNGVTYIGHSAFRECTSLTSVYCKPTTPPTGGQYMFYNNASSRKIYVPASSIETYRLADGWNDYAADIVRYDFEKGEVVKVYSEITYTTTDGNIVTPVAGAFDANIVSNTYENGQGVIKFDGEITKIGEDAFKGRMLASITIPDSVTSIGSSVFNFCTSLARVDITDLSAWCKITFGNTSSNPLCNGAKLYLNGEMVTDLSIPSDITALKAFTFNGCTSLESVTLHEGVVNVLAAFCNCPNLAAFYGKFASADNRCLIVDGTFQAFAPAGLTEYAIPDSVTSIARAFYGCTKLIYVLIPDSVTKIGPYAFYGCTSLIGVMIPDSVTTIGSYAFQNCDSLIGITIPDSITSIGSYAFYSCNSLKEVYCMPTTPPTGGSRMFDSNASGRKIYVPRNSVSAYKAASGWSGYASYIVGYDF